MRSFATQSHTSIQLSRIVSITSHHGVFVATCCCCCCSEPYALSRLLLSSSSAQLTVGPLISNWQINTLIWVGSSNRSSNYITDIASNWRWRFSLRYLHTGRYSFQFRSFVHRASNLSTCHPNVTFNGCRRRSSNKTWNLANADKSFDVGWCESCQYEQLQFILHEEANPYHLKSKKDAILAMVH